MSLQPTALKEVKLLGFDPNKLFYPVGCFLVIDLLIPFPKSQVFEGLDDKVKEGGW